ncbi:hypothetical protein RPALISO_52 [Ruegeria phage RpAliso]|nr:hypothetical protein RPALISO_52 [Ruegeria phage RpAliso]
MENPAHNKVTIFRKDGTPLTTSRLNARELVSTGKYVWHKEKAKVDPVAVEPEPTPEPTPEPEPEAPAEPEPTPEPESDADLDPDTADLDALAAMAIDGTVEEYLNGFSVDALKTIAEKRYNEKLRSNVSKASAIEKIIGFEEAKIEAEADAE